MINGAGLVLENVRIPLLTRAEASTISDIVPYVDCTHACLPGCLQSNIPIFKDLTQVRLYTYLLRCCEENIRGGFRFYSVISSENDREQILDADGFQLQMHIGSRASRGHRHRECISVLPGNGNDLFNGLEL